MFDINFAAIHELDQTPNVLELAVLHDDDRILVCVAIREDRIEECAARAQHDPVRFDGLALARERHVTEAAAVQQLREHRLQVAVMILPSQTVLLQGHFGDA